MKLKHRIKLASLGAVVILFAPGVQADNDPRVFTVNCDVKPNLQKVLRKAAPGDTILVSGTCLENVEVPIEAQRITLDGQGTAVINGPDAANAAVQINGRGIVLKGFTISGGFDGVNVGNGGSATIDGNIIQQTGADGVHVAKSSEAVIVNNTIQSNAENGIHVTEASSARIGFRAGRPTATAEPNIIQNNGGRGIRVNRSSAGRIYANTIRNNGNSGIDVRRAAFADISSNQIDGNAGDGILVNQNSAVVLGADTTEDPVADNPNGTTVPNAGVGIRCGTNSSADGRRGTLTGSAGAVNFDATCVNSTIP